VKDVKSLRTRLEGVEHALSSAEQSVKATDSELRLLRSRHARIEEELVSTRKQRDSLDQQVAASKVNMQTLEDRALQAERDRSSWQREMDSLGDQLEKEITKRMQLEKSHKTIANDVETLQMKVVEQDQYIKGLRKELRDKEAELIKSISLQDKTIVEHVHVLEEAKRYTDKQLSE
jgi:myosin protein heavy chain